jgi:hypothetical protein
MDITCGQCESMAVEPGFLGDEGEASHGYGRWIAGELERGILGGARRMGRLRREIRAYRCTVCGHLELFAVDEV